MAQCAGSDKDKGQNPQAVNPPVWLVMFESGSLLLVGFLDGFLDIGRDGIALTLSQLSVGHCSDDYKSDGGM